MGQKINPISLRININRNFDSCWFQDNPTKYSELLHKDLNIREYLKSLFSHVGIHTGRITFQFFQKKLIIHYFFYDSQKKNILKKSTFSSIKYKQLLALDKSFNTCYMEKYLSFVLQNQRYLQQLNKNIFLRIFLTHYFFSQNQNIFSTKQFINSSYDYLFINFLKKSIDLSTSTKVETRYSSPVPLLSIRCSPVAFDEVEKNNERAHETPSNGVKNHELNEVSFASVPVRYSKDEQGTSSPVIVPCSLRELANRANIEQNSRSNICQPESILEKTRARRILFAIDKNLSNIEYILSKNNQLDTCLLPLKMNSRFQSAHFICEYVCQRLQENITFRQIFKQLCQEIKTDSCGQVIQGMRIVCAGRLNGVEMARVESKKFGQTSLHVFSSKIDYASSQAYTLFGLLGVKVWLCYRNI